MGKKEPGVVMRLSLAWLARNLFAFAFVLAGAAVAQDATKPGDAPKNEAEKFLPSSKSDIEALVATNRICGD